MSKITHLLYNLVYVFLLCAGCFFGFTWLFYLLTLCFFVYRPSDRVRQLGSMLHSYARQPRSRSPSPPPSLVKCHSPILESSRSVLRLSM